MPSILDDLIYDQSNSFAQAEDRRFIELAQQPRADDQLQRMIDENRRLLAEAMAVFPPSLTQHEGPGSAHIARLQEHLHRLEMRQREQQAYPLMVSMEGQQASALGRLVGSAREHMRREIDRWQRDAMYVPIFPAGVEPTYMGRPLAQEDRRWVRQEIMGTWDSSTSGPRVHEQEIINGPPVRTHMGSLPTLTELRERYPPLEPEPVPEPTPARRFGRVIDIES
jgi:hypothetical protein